MTEHDLSAADRERLVETLTRLRANRDGNLQPQDYYRRWSEVEADAIAPVVADMLAAARQEARDDDWVAVRLAEARLMGRFEVGVGGRPGTDDPEGLLADLIARERADAWDEGYATCLGDFDIAARREARSCNPYCVTEEADRA